MIFKKLVKLNLIASGMFLLIATFLSFLELVLRNSISFSIVGIDQIVTYLVIWSTFLGAAHATIQNSHIKMDLLDHATGPKVGFFLNVMVLSLGAFFSAVLFLSGILLVSESIMLKEMTIGLIRIPLWYVQSVMVIAGFLFFVGSMRNLIYLVFYKINVKESEAL